MRMNVTSEPDPLQQEAPGHSITALEVVFICIGLFGFVTNCVSAAIFRKLKSFILRTCRVLLIHQSCVDSVASLFLAGRMASPERAYFTDLPSSVWSQMFCRLWTSNTLFWMLSVLSIYSLIALSVDHYVAVLHPTFFLSINKVAEATTRCKIYLFLLILVAWLPSVTYIVYPALRYDVVNGLCVSVTQVSTAYSYYNISLKLFIPFTALCYLYLRMLCRYRQHVSNVVTALDAPIPATESKANKRIKKALFLLCCLRTVLYVICFAPNQFMYFFSVAKVIQNLSGTTILSVSIALLYLYACINPIIYFATLKPFRKKLKYMCYHFTARLGVTRDISETVATAPFGATTSVAP